MKIDDKILQALDFAAHSVKAIYLGEDQWAELMIATSKRDCNINFDFRGLEDFKVYGYLVIRVKLKDYLRAV